VSTDHQSLPEEILEAIATDQFKVHKKFHSELVALGFPPYRNPMLILQDAVVGLNEPPEPQPPKRPIHLFSRLRAYAQELFDVELRYYLDHPVSIEKAPGIVRRIESMVIQRIQEVGNLTYHATIDEMRDAIHEELERTVPLATIRPAASEAKSTGIPTPHQTNVPLRGYRVQVRKWMRDHEIPSVRVAARRLGVSESVLKSIMTNKGKIRHSPETLEMVLKSICDQSGDQSQVTGDHDVGH